jgi:hypothetical protein
MAGDPKKGGARSNNSNGRRRGTVGQEAAKAYEPRPDYPVSSTHAPTRQWSHT